mmetsp:Transcript_59365/g.165771  ORF Transcript_59365/g.165771 Transcript_59365/m.165771 type:complete len:243 (-) Transcript_59365:158-886(-)
MVLLWLTLRPRLRQSIALAGFVCFVRALQHWLRGHRPATSRRRRLSDYAAQQGSCGSSDSPRGGRSRTQPRQQIYDARAQDGNRTLRHGKGLGTAAPQRPGRRAVSGREKPLLWAAAERGDAITAGNLLRSGHPVDEGHSGWTPLMKAAEEGHCEIVAMLLDHRANLEAGNHKGRTVLSFAAAPSMGRRPSMTTLSFLLQARADLEKRDARGETARARALRDGQTQSVDAIDVFKASSVAEG